MLFSNWLRPVGSSRRDATCRFRRSSTRPGIARRQRSTKGLAVAADVLEERLLLAADFGDAPDTGAGTGTGNYQTTLADDGPRHTIVAGLFLGAAVDGEGGSLQNVRANADDVNRALPDDEDGVLSPFTDLLGTEQSAPTVTLQATNTTGQSATLYGWIDYDRDGVFENATERASITVPAGTTNGRFTLTFTVIPGGSAGSTYARFRLSTDAGARHSTGAALDGEVEDYTFEITVPTNASPNALATIASGTPGAPPIQDGDRFGSAIANLGDLDGDGVTDLAVGIDSTSASHPGAFHILNMNADGTVKHFTTITRDTNGGPALADGDNFGRALALLGDLDGDGINDLAVGARRDDTGGTNRGAVHLLLLNADGTVKSFTKIASGTPGAPDIADGDLFGSSVGAIGDFDGDGVPDLAVGATSTDRGGYANVGSIYVLLLNIDGTVKRSTEISSGIGGGRLHNYSDGYGGSVTSPGDLDGDGVPDLVVGEPDVGSIPYYAGEAHVLLLNPDGTVKSTETFDGSSAGVHFQDSGSLGAAVAPVGDLDGDGIDDLAIGGPRVGSTGQIFVALLNSDGSVKSASRFRNPGTGFQGAGEFGAAVTSLGDFNSDGVVDLAVGDPADDTGGSASFSDRGAVQLVNFTPPLDFGDAPKRTQSDLPRSYPTLLNVDGPRHVATGPILGTRRDTESDGQPARNALGDDDSGADDDDGIRFQNGDTILFSSGSSLSRKLSVTLSNPDPDSNLLDAWIDFNRDGDFSDRGERVLNRFDLGTVAGTQTVRISVPRDTGDNITTGVTYARFRLSTAGTSRPTGLAADGEVEDYRVSLLDETARIGETGSVTFSQHRPDDWETIRLHRSFVNPVVIAQPATQNGGQPLTVRIRNVRSNRFEIQLDEWDYLDGRHATETVGWLVVEAGTYRLGSGQYLQAGTVSVNHAWTTVNLAPSAFNETPIVLTQSQTVNESSAITTRQRNASSDGFDVRLQEEQGSDGRHAVETVGFVAVSSGQGQSGIPFASRLAGTDIGPAFTDVAFNFDGFTEPPVLLAGMQTTSGIDTATLRLLGLTASGMQLRVEEEQSADTEVAHVPESVGYVALGRPGFLRGAAVRTVAETHSITVSSPQPGTVTRLTFASEFVNPVVIAQTATRNDIDPVTVRVSDVTSTGVGISLQEWDYQDGIHGAETVNVLVVEAGLHVLRNGTVLTAGTVDVNQRTKFVDLSLSQYPSHPVVLAQTQTVNESAAVTARVDFFFNDQFQVTLQEEEAADGIHAFETVGYVAIRPSGDRSGRTIGENPRAAEFRAGNPFNDIGVFSSTINPGSFETPPAVFAALQSRNDEFTDNDTAIARIDSVTRNSFRVRVEEEQSADAETDHPRETIGYLAVTSEAFLEGIDAVFRDASLFD